jgi:translation elongation factor EF-Tu-like GTPase
LILTALPPGDDKDNYGQAAVVKLMEAVDVDIEMPPRAVDEPFAMPIEGVYSIAGRGTVVTGRVEKGKIKTGDDVAIVGLDNDQSTTCTGVQMFHKGTYLHARLFRVPNPMNEMSNEVSTCCCLFCSRRDGPR